MIFISAQPAKFYFKWQLEVQLYNFNRLGIQPDHIHVLFCYNSIEGIDERILAFTKECKMAQFFFYEDTRPVSSYEPTCRPHIIKKHYDKHPYLEQKTVFYHDCDIIFRELPDFDYLSKGNKWYMSDADSYIGIDLLRSLSVDILKEMCGIIGAEVDEIMKISVSGGAQTILKNATSFFWEKVEIDSNNLHHYLSTNRVLHEHKFKLATESAAQELSINWIQVWCADMWAILWNSRLFGHEMEVHPELEFCWAKDPVDRWHETKIFHNAGVRKEESNYIFCKSDFNVVSPFETDLSFVLDTKCSSMYVKEIIDYIEFKKFDFSDGTFLITTRIDSEERLRNLMTVVNYLSKYFNTEILLLEADRVQKINEKKLPKNVCYYFVEDYDQVFYRSKYNNALLSKVSKEIVVIQDADVIVPYNQIIEAIEKMRTDEPNIITPYNSGVINVSNEKTISRFIQSLNTELLHLSMDAGRSYVPFGGIIFYRTEWYKRIGGDNTNITGWGAEDLERVVRGILVGGRFSRISGRIYHLDHPRLENSDYPSDGTFDSRFNALWDISRLNSSDLQKYIGDRLVSKVDCN